jgi:hypothetical protein
MNSHDEQQLERAIGRELKSLPELTVPAALADRVLATLEQRSREPWYRRSWETWPVVWQVASFAAMLALFGGLCLAGGELSRTEPILQAAQRIGQGVSCLDSIGNTLKILVASVLLVLKNLGTPCLLACLIVGALGYTLFLALGAACCRLAFAKHRLTHL